MKIYFEDGRLLSGNEFAGEFLKEKIGEFTRIDAEDGYSNCEYVLEKLRKENYDAIVYTNYVRALSNFYAWNDELKVPEIYLRAGYNNAFIRIDKLTDRKLREAHNIEKMYVNNAFRGYGCQCIDANIKE